MPTISESTAHFVSGFLVGFGSLAVIVGFAGWWFVSSLFEIFVSWAEDHSLTLAPSGFTAYNQIPLACGAIIAAGFFAVLMGLIIGIQARE